MISEVKSQTSAKMDKVIKYVIDEFDKKKNTYNLDFAM